MYYGGVVQHQLNYVPLHTCTYFFFLWKSLDVRWKLNYPKKSTKGEKVQKLPLRGVITGENKIACYWVVVVLLISRWGVHTAHDTYLISSPVSFRFFVYRVRRTSEKISEMCSSRLAFVILSQMAEFRFHFSLSYCLVFFHF